MLVAVPPAISGILVLVTPQSISKLLLEMERSCSGNGDSDDSEPCFYHYSVHIRKRYASGPDQQGTRIYVNGRLEEPTDTLARKERVRSRFRPLEHLALTNLIA